MEELHKTSIGCHGNLKSTNVLVDSYWICKVADHGLHSFRETKLMVEESSQAHSGSVIENPAYIEKKVHCIFLRNFSSLRPSNLTIQ